MSLFVSRTFASGSDIALQLGTEEWARTLSIGNFWNKIRIGCLLAVNPVSTTSTPTSTGPVIGMCSGINSTFGMTSTNNFVGYQAGFAGTSGGAYATGTGGTQPVFAWNGSNYGITKVGTTINGVTMGGSWNSDLPVQGVGTQRRYMILVDILKGTPNYTVTQWAQDPPSHGGSTAVDSTTADLLFAMSQTGAITLPSNGDILQAHAVAIVASEVTGALDTVNVYCSLSGYPMEIYSVAVQKMS
jgi:hypothetical protein